MDSIMEAPFKCTQRGLSGFCVVCGAEPGDECGQYQQTASAIVTTPNLDRISPDHYARYEIEPIDFIEKNDLGFAVGNVIKYTCRYDAKNGIEDLKKAMRYLEFLLAKAEGQDPSSVCD